MGFAKDLIQQLEEKTLLQLVNLEHEGFNLGELCLPSLRWALRRHNIPDNEAPRGLFLQYLVSAVSLACQFNELYDHYRREQMTVKQWIDLYPESDAWKGATSEGKSVIIRAEHTAKVIGYAVYENESGMPLNTIGEFEVEAELAIPMLSSYRAATKEIFGAGMRSSEIEGGRWLCYMPGEFTTLMALFSTEPASTQLEAMENLHRLFERANRTLLAQQVVDPNELVFPHAYFLGRVK